MTNKRISYTIPLHLINPLTRKVWGKFFIQPMSAKKIYLTKEGIEELRREHGELVGTKRPQILERLTQARSMGDLSENAEYVAAREELSFTDGRIDELEALLRQATLINHAKGNGKMSVQLGSRVTLHKDGKKEVFTLVGEWEADPAEKKISHQSPLGKALIGRKVGEKVEVAAPAGKILYTVLEVE